MAGFELLDPKFSELHPAAIGPDGARHFIVADNELLCIRVTCEGCPFEGRGCAFEEVEVQTSAIPHPRRGIGMEGRGFQVLAFRDGHSYETFPRELWDNPYSERAYAHEANLHWIHTDPTLATFHAIKGQLRYYGTREAFEASPYAAYFEVLSEYDPSHHPVSLDYSAIEPRVSTLTAREPQWVEVFQGKPKVIFREIELGPLPEGVGRPRTVVPAQGRTWCYLAGEMDKADFKDQCGKCKAASACRVRHDHFKNVAEDWHGLNTEGLYGAEFSHANDKIRRKELRDIGKIVGLLLCYGGTAFSVSGNMRTTKEEAQLKIDNFFRKLTVLAQYMRSTKANVRKTGMVYNLFNRARDMSRWAFAEQWKDVGYAERTALNHPIQSTAADILKIGSIRADELIQARGWNPLYGAHPPHAFETMPSYTAIVCAILSSIHDELMFLMLSSGMESLIPVLYETLQLNDVLEMFGCGFQLELDCEFDPNRTWTSSEKFDTARIYLLNRLQSGSGSSQVNPPSSESRPTLVEIPLDACTQEFVDTLTRFLQGGLPVPFEVPPQDQWLRLAVQNDGRYQFHPSKFPRGLFEYLRVPHRLSYYRDRAA